MADATRVGSSPKVPRSAPTPACRRTAGPARWLAGLAAAAVIVGATAVGAQEIAPFRLTGVEGTVFLDYMQDNLTTRQEAVPGWAGSGTSRTTQTDLRTGVFVMTHSYVYHPGLASIDFGVGPIYERTSNTVNGIGMTAQEPLYDLVARVKLLKEKPYQGSVYYEHLNPQMLVSPGEAMVLETTKYGFDVAVLNSITPTPIHFEAWKSQTQGSGASRIIDQRVEQATFTASRGFNSTGFSDFQYTGVRQDSANGSYGLPIQTTAMVSNSASLSTQLQFGANREWQLFNPIGYTEQKFTSAGSAPLTTQVGDVTFILRGQHSPALFTSTRLEANATTQNDLRNLREAFATTATYTPSDKLLATLSAGGEIARGTDLDATRYGAEGSARYTQPLPVGTAYAAYAFLVGVRDQQAKSATVAVYGEALPLPGVTPVPLKRANVVAGSVVVNNATRTQVYVEGLDYLLSVAGQTTRVQRQPAGNILDGETVLVDYSYGTGGTFGYRQLDNAVDLGWNLGSYGNVHLRYRDAPQTLTSGDPAFPLNSIRSWMATVQADIPIPGPVDMMVGGIADWEDYRQTIGPYQRQGYGGYFQTTFPMLPWAGVRVGARYAQTDYSGQPLANQKLTAYDLWLWANSPIGVEFLFNATAQNDTTGGIAHRLDYATVKALWRYRRLTMTINGSYNRETQGGITKDRAYTQFLLRRDF